MARTRNPDRGYLQRKLKEPEQAVLLAAGQGDIIDGFYECVSWYQHCYNLGLRPTMNYEHLGITAGILNDGIADGLKLAAEIANSPQSPSEKPQDNRKQKASG